MTDQSTDAGTTAPETKPATTLYTVLRGDDEGRFRVVKDVKVKAGRSDVARKKVLEELSQAEPDTPAFIVVAVPARAWDPKTYGLETPTPRFVAQ